MPPGLNDVTGLGDRGICFPLPRLAAGPSQQSDGREDQAWKASANDRARNGKRALRNGNKRALSLITALVEGRVYDIWRGILIKVQ